MTVILGGGIAGLSAAHYALENANLGKIVLLEMSNRLGGWIRSKILPEGVVFEQGPRTLRCNTQSAVNTLNLLDYLKLNDKVLAITNAHPAARKRMIYVHDQLHQLPGVMNLFKSHTLIKRPLLSILWTDVTATQVKKNDDSLYNFVERRMGKDIADYIISPLIRGICAGDAHQISANMLMPHLFEAEQTYGSMLRGILINKIKHTLKAKKNKSTNNKVEDELSNLAQMSKRDGWTLFGLKGGLEQFPSTLGASLRSRGVDIQMEKKCERLSFKEDHVELVVNGESSKYSRVISSLPAKNLAYLLKDQHPELARELGEIPSVTVAIVNLQFPKNVLFEMAFGFLTSPIEQDLPILGVIFDSCIFPQKDSTVLTVMMGGAWFEKHFGTNPSKEQLVTVAVENTRRILNINEVPRMFSVDVLRDCIPQYVVGHNERINRIHNYIDEHGLPLVLCGSSYHGVGINDVILSAKQAVSSIV